MELTVKDRIFFELVATNPKEEEELSQMLDAANQRSEGKLMVIGITGRTLILASNRIR